MHRGLCSKAYLLLILCRIYYAGLWGCRFEQKTYEYHGRLADVSSGGLKHDLRHVRIWDGRKRRESP